MKRLFQLGLIIGFAGAIAIGYFVPGMATTRFPSQTTVVVNGGRAEHFVIRLPADLIHSAGIHAGTISGKSQAGAATLGNSGVDLAQFKLRDMSGNVIGLAARHRNEYGTDVSTLWMLVIPSRGTVAYSASSPIDGDIIATLAQNAWPAGQEFAENLSIEAEYVARSQAATSEFSGIDFELVEVWTISGIDEDGRLRGTIELSTIGRRN